MIIRPETPHDYAAIAALNLRAFGHIAEPMIVTMHRNRQAFDPELSLVAEIDGQIAGHVLFSPQSIRLLGEEVRAVNLAPIAVDPARQRQGIGGALIREGHDIARSKGYTVSYLLGHVEYYPRFGYRTGVYGVSSVEVSPHSIPQASLVTRAPTEADLPALRELWLHEEGLVDFAIEPGVALMDWISPNPLVRSTVYLLHDAVVGYTRIHSAEPQKPRMFLARDADAPRAIAAHLVQNAPSLTLPLHPLSASANAFGTPQCKAWGAGMALSLSPGIFDDYYEQLQLGKRPPGRPIWPVAFDFE